MKKLILVSVLFLSACGPTRPDNSTNVGGNVNRFHDDQANVTCWTWAEGYAGGISCIPDKDVKGTADYER